MEAHNQTHCLLIQHERESSNSFYDNWAHAIYLHTIQGYGNMRALRNGKPEFEGGLAYG
jgi:hypothetical protein